ncbi:hypothetical protein KA001_00475, partial [Patescibacteria group bacterium]|nr:hypothetical protein [Patescibacteria group bacterium]
MKLQKRLNRVLLVVAILLVAWSAWVFYDNQKVSEPVKKPAEHIWSFRSIDTMKYSRDYAREKGYDESFRKEIDKQ